KNYALLRDAVDLLEENIKNKDKNTENNLDITKKDESEPIDISSNNIAPKSAQKQAFGQPSNQSYSASLTDSSDKKTDFQSSQKIVSLSKNSIAIVEMKGLSRAECVLRMCACDLFALPSHSEGSPQALKEAMAVNCPCLATDIADVRELFGDEPGHWILRNPRKTHERWDEDEKSLDEMVDLLKEALAYEGRTNGRKRIEELQLSNEAVAKRIIKIYREILKV
ncbi:MAG: glycosyltransferase family 4 protein, partial [Paludibacteraceae bacterium]|nr:glycosyltransferase family 4 protein [Paludibacteraceae bacterium]